MLFNSVQFVFAFLPVVLIVFFLFGWLGLRQVAIGWAFLASLFFYGWENPWRLLPLILASAAFNFFAGRGLARFGSKRLLIMGVTGNLLLLGVFKYTAFLLGSFGWLTGFSVPQADIPLPIGISFGVVSYALQIYFDFSAYSDMAIGLALMMGITFPLNFNSPYKAASLIDFWRRWHMTLSRFLRDYLYISLGGNRKGPLRRHINLLITMVLGGLWHGATWNFAVWGAIHGAGLLLNHLWRDIAGRLRFTLPRPLGWTLTLLVVLFAWVPFRAETLDSSLLLWQSMLGLHGFSGPTVENFRIAIGWIVALSAIALFAPNTQEIFALDWRAVSTTRLRWRPSGPWAVAVGCLFGVAVAGMVSKPTMFLYFRF
jgi:D-alanyl-lipoteichoic acid acyltransferase DltB (MBOAT superfamily)